MKGKYFLARHGMFMIFSILKRCGFAIDFSIASLLGKDTIGWCLSTMSRDKGPLGISIVCVGHVVIGTDRFSGGNTWADDLHVHKGFHGSCEFQVSQTFTPVEFQWIVF